MPVYAPAPRKDDPAERDLLAGEAVKRAKKGLKVKQAKAEKAERKAAGKETVEDLAADYLSELRSWNQEALELAYSQLLDEQAGLEDEEQAEAEEA